MAAGLRATGAKLAHDAAQPVSPVTGSKGFAITGNTLNKDFFGGVGDHLERVISNATSSGKPPAENRFYLIEDST